MKLHQILALLILAAFYTAYFAKMLVQGQKGIRTNQIGRGSKPPETRRVEQVMGIATIVIVMVEVWSIVFDRRWSASAWLTAAGLCIAAAGVLIFVLAMCAMRDSWRAGISRSEQTELVTDGIYRFSRNPAFLGFDLMYIGVLTAFFNIPLLCITALTVVSLHRQILQEERFLLTVFGERYAAYCAHTCRYLGRR